MGELESGTGLCPPAAPPAPWQRAWLRRLVPPGPSASLLPAAPQIGPDIRLCAGGGRCEQAGGQPQANGGRSRSSNANQSPSALGLAGAFASICPSHRRGDRGQQGGGRVLLRGWGQRSISESPPPTPLVPARVQPPFPHLSPNRKLH